MPATYIVWILNDAFVRLQPEQKVAQHQKLRFGIVGLQQLQGGQNALIHAQYIVELLEILRRQPARTAMIVDIVLPEHAQRPIIRPGAQVPRLNRGAVHAPIRMEIVLDDDVTQHSLCDW